MFIVKLLINFIRGIELASIIEVTFAESGLFSFTKLINCAWCFINRSKGQSECAETNSKVNELFDISSYISSFGFDSIATLTKVVSNLVKIIIFSLDSLVELRSVTELNI